MKKRDLSQQEKPPQPAHTRRVSEYDQRQAIARRKIEEIKNQKELQKVLALLN